MCCVELHSGHARLYPPLESTRVLTATGEVASLGDEGDMFVRAFVQPLVTVEVAVCVVLRVTAVKGLEILAGERRRPPTYADTGALALPGGKVTAGDIDVFHTAARELREETCGAISVAPGDWAAVALRLQYEKVPGYAFTVLVTRSASPAARG